MYQAERKLAYLEYTTEDKTNAKNTFAATEKFERDAGKDLCEMSTEELVAILLSFKAKTTIRQKRTIITNYINWCRALGYCKVNWLDYKLYPNEKIFAAIDESQERYYLTPEKYEEYYQKILAANDGVYNASIFVALYEGIAGNYYINLTHLKTGDIDPETRTVRLYEGNTRTVSERLIKLLLETSQIRTLQNKSQPSHLTESLYPDSVWYSTKAMAPESMWRRFRDRLKMMKEIVGDDRLTASTVTSSGFFNYVCSSAIRDGLDIKADLLDTSTKVDKRVAGRVPSEYKYKKYIEEFGSNMSFAYFKYSFSAFAKYL